MKFQVCRIPLELGIEKQTITVNSTFEICDIVEAVDLVTHSLAAYLILAPLDLIVVQDKDTEEISLEIICLELLDNEPVALEDFQHTEYISTIAISKKIFSFGYTVPEHLRNTEDED
jgi:hypothetical protein